MIGVGQGIGHEDSVVKAGVVRCGMVIAGAVTVGTLSRIAETRETARGIIVNLPDILFDFDKSTLRAQGREILSKISGILLVAKGYTLKLEGHTDSVGSDEYNQRLSERRAQSVRDYLAQSRVGATLAWAIGLLGLTLAIVGVFGVFAYAVEERRREIGIRMALGATTSQVIGAFVTFSGRAMLFGLGAGLLGSLAWRRSRIPAVLGLTALAGYFPASVLRLGEDLPAGIAMQWAGRWGGEVRPAATMISAGLADPRMRIEIEVTALRRS